MHFLLPLLLLAAPPATPKVPLQDTFHGVTVSEDYRWLEDAQSPEVKAWSEAQRAYARPKLDALPHAAPLRRELTALLSAPITRYRALEPAGEGLVVELREPPKEQDFLVWLDDPANPKSARVVCDPNALDPTGATEIDWFVPSPDGRLLAVSLSKAGTESGDVHLFDLKTGAPVAGEVVPRVNGGTAGGSLAWTPDSQGFYYTRYPRPGERPEADADFFVQVYEHRLGQKPEADRYVLGKDFVRIAEIDLRVDPTGRLLITVQNGDGGEFEHFLRAPDGALRRLTQYQDRIVQVVFGPKDDLYLVSLDGSPKGKLLRLALSAKALNEAKVVLPEGKDALVPSFWGPPTVLPTANRLYVTFQLGGPSEVRVFDLDGKPLGTLGTEPISRVVGLARADQGDDVYLRANSFVSPATWYRYQAAANKLTATGLKETAAARFDDVEVRRELATSKDGTQIPLNILAPKGLTLDGSHACIVYGYGGYGVNLEPWFDPSLRPLFDRGVIFVVANLRGGGEFGEDWHRQGYLTQKQNVFDDFAAALDHMVTRGYTRKDKLAAMGGSNGGLLMGATLTQHPEKVQAVVSQVGIYDMLRVELSANGAFNVTEFGTVKDQAQFKALYAYSPYHHVQDGIAYPTTLFTTGENDPRVDPMQSRKMVARLQAATAGGEAKPILLRTSAGAGHGESSLSGRIEEDVDTYAFLLWALGVKP